MRNSHHHRKFIYRSIVRTSQVLRLTTTLERVFPPSFFRFSLFSDDDSELVHFEASDVIFAEEQELLSTMEHVHDDEKVQNSWRPPDGIIDPDEIVSESHEEIPLRVTAKYDRK